MDIESREHDGLSGFSLQPIAWMNMPTDGVVPFIRILRIMSKREMAKFNGWSGA